MDWPQVVGDGTRSPLFAALTAEVPPSAADSEATDAIPRARGLFHPGDVLNDTYEVRGKIGEGGMGTVWMAEQREPVKRLVALKLTRMVRGDLDWIVMKCLEK